MRAKVLLAGAALVLLTAAAPGGEPGPVTDAMFAAADPAEIAVGRLLFWDPILSGNRNISCGTCHHPRFGTSDGVSLDLGEGGVGLGPERVADPANIPEERVPRNAPALFNLGAREFTVLFHDGRVEVDPRRKAGFRTPLEDDMVLDFDGILSAQTMFPVTSPDEMAGHYSESDVSQAVREGIITGPGGVWDILARRVAAVPEYRALFAAAVPEIAAGREIGFTDISNAIGAFMGFEWRSDDSPFDRHLRGEVPLAGPAAAGMELFYGKAGCAGCHSGPFQTDHRFHAMGEPQLGPGKGARFEPHDRDEGRFRVTNDPADLYAFRTPSLRNIALTGPYGHAGAHAALPAFLTAHLDPKAALAGYDRALVRLPALAGAEDWAVMDDPAELAAIAAAVVTPPVALSPAEIDALYAFLLALTGDTALEGRLGVPQTVPSGLKVDR
jgi:cytochrome c peroxidase